MNRVALIFLCLASVCQGTTASSFADTLASEFQDAGIHLLKKQFLQDASSKYTCSYGSDILSCFEKSSSLKLLSLNCEGLDSCSGYSTIGDTLCIYTQKIISLFDVPTGKRLWSRNNQYREPLGSLVTSYQKKIRCVFFYESFGQVITCLDSENGKSRWKSPKLPFQPVFVAQLSRRVYLFRDSGASRDDYLEFGVLDLETGETMRGSEKNAVGEGPASSPTGFPWNSGGPEGNSLILSDETIHLEVIEDSFPAASSSSDGGHLMTKASSARSPKAMLPVAHKDKSGNSGSVDLPGKVQARGRLLLANQPPPHLPPSPPMNSNPSPVSIFSPPPGPYICPITIPGRSASGTRVFYNSTNINTAAAERLAYEAAERETVVLPETITVQMACVAASGAAATAAAMDAGTVNCSLPANRTLSTDGLLHDSVADNTTSFPCQGLVSSLAAMELAVTPGTVVELACHLRSISDFPVDALSIAECVTYDILDFASSTGSNFTCLATTAPARVALPTLATDVALHVNCTADSNARPDTFAVQLRSLLSNASASSIDAMLCSSPSGCSRPATTFLSVLANWTRQSNIDIVDYLSRPPPPQPPNRRQSPPPPPPPAPLAQYWQIQYEAPNSYCLSLSMAPRNVRQFQDEGFLSGQQVFNFSDAIQVFSHTFGGFEEFSDGMDVACTHFGYTPYRVPSIRLSGVGLTGVLGVDLLRTAMLLDELPVSNLVELDLSNNSISGTLPDNSSAFHGYLYPALVWNLSRNLLSGPVANESFFHSALAVDLSHNLLNGTLPANWTVLETAAYIDLSHNRFSGTLPALWALDQQLDTGDATQAIDPTRRRGLLSSDGGSISSRSLLQSSQKWYPPPVLARVRGFSRVRLGGNRLSGSLPVSWLTLASAELDLSDNELTGTIPSSWKNVEGMERFDISGNAGLTGVITGLSWQTVLEVVRVKGTNISLDLNALSSRTAESASPPVNASSGSPSAKRLRHGNFWAAIISAVHSGAVGFSNLVLPGLNVDDLRIFCEIFRSYYLYRNFFENAGVLSANYLYPSSNETSSSSNTSSSTTGVTYVKLVAMVAAAAESGGAPQVESEYGMDLPAVTLMLLDPSMPNFFETFKDWISTMSSNHWIKSEDWCLGYGARDSDRLKIVLGIWIPTACILLCIFAPAPFLIYAQRQEDNQRLLCERLYQSGQVDPLPGSPRILRRLLPFLYSSPAPIAPAPPGREVPLSTKSAGAARPISEGVEDEIMDFDEDGLDSAAPVWAQTGVRLPSRGGGTIVDGAAGDRGRREAFFDADEDNGRGQDGATVIRQLSESNNNSIPELKDFEDVEEEEDSSRAIRLKVHSAGGGGDGGDGGTLLEEASLLNIEGSEFFRQSVSNYDDEEDGATPVAGPIRMPSRTAEEDEAPTTAMIKDVDTGLDEAGQNDVLFFEGPDAACDTDACVAKLVSGADVAADTPPVCSFSSPARHPLLEAGAPATPGRAEESIRSAPHSPLSASMAPLPLSTLPPANSASAGNGIQHSGQGDGWSQRDLLVTPRGQDGPLSSTKSSTRGIGDSLAAQLRATVAGSLDITSQDRKSVMEALGGNDDQNKEGGPSASKAFEGSPKVLVSTAESIKALPVLFSGVGASLKDTSSLQRSGAAARLPSGGSSEAACFVDVSSIIRSGDASSARNTPSPTPGVGATASLSGMASLARGSQLHLMPAGFGGASPTRSGLVLASFINASSILRSSAPGGQPHSPSPLPAATSGSSSVPTLPPAVKSPAIVLKGPVMASFVGVSSLLRSAEQPQRQHASAAKKRAAEDAALPSLPGVAMHMPQGILASLTGVASLRRGGRDEQQQNNEQHRLLAIAEDDAEGGSSTMSSPAPASRGAQVSLVGVSSFLRSASREGTEASPKNQLQPRNSSEGDSGSYRTPRSQTSAMGPGLDPAPSPTRFYPGAAAAITGLRSIQRGDAAFSRSSSPCLTPVSACLVDVSSLTRGEDDGSGSSVASSARRTPGPALSENSLASLTNVASLTRGARSYATPMSLSLHRLTGAASASFLNASSILRSSSTAVSHRDSPLPSPAGEGCTFNQQLQPLFLAGPVAESLEMAVTSFHDGDLDNYTSSHADEPTGSPTEVTPQSGLLSASQDASHLPSSWSTTLIQEVSWVDTDMRSVADAPQSGRQVFSQAKPGPRMRGPIDVAGDPGGEATETSLQPQQESPKPQSAGLAPLGTRSDDEDDTRRHLGGGGLEPATTYVVSAATVMDDPANLAAMARRKYEALDMPPIPEPPITNLGSTPPPTTKTKVDPKLERTPAELTLSFLSKINDYISPRLSALLYVFDVASDVYYIGAYLSWDFNVAPPVVCACILGAFFIWSWAVRLHVSYELSTPAAAVLALITFPVGIAYELVWDALTITLGYLLGSPEKFNHLLHITTDVCCAARPAAFGLATNLRAYRVKLIVQPWADAIPQAVAQAVLFMLSYRVGAVIEPRTYTISACASAAVMIKGALSIMYYLSKGVRPGAIFAQRGVEVFDNELDKLENIQNAKATEYLLKNKSVKDAVSAIGYKPASDSDLKGTPDQQRRKLLPEAAASMRTVAATSSFAVPAVGSVPQPGLPVSYFGAPVDPDQAAGGGQKAQAGSMMAGLTKALAVTGKWKSKLNASRAAEEVRKNKAQQQAASSPALALSALFSRNALTVEPAGGEAPDAGTGAPLRAAGAPTPSAVAGLLGNPPATSTFAPSRLRPRPAPSQTRLAAATAVSQPMVNPAMNPDMAMAGGYAPAVGAAPTFYMMPTAYGINMTASPTDGAALAASYAALYGSGAYDAYSTAAAQQQYMTSMMMGLGGQTEMAAWQQQMAGNTSGYYAAAAGSMPHMAASFVQPQAYPATGGLGAVNSLGRHSTSTAYPAAGGPPVNSSVELASSMLQATNLKMATVNAAAMALLKMDEEQVQHGAAS